jgi:ABC-type cobalamin/Fe3+-siderophores transport system ATPase subunit
MSEAEDLALSSEQLDAIFARHLQPALDHRQRVARSTIVTVMGPAASGKTTLARVMPQRLGVNDPYIWGDGRAPQVAWAARL